MFLSRLSHQSQCTWMENPLPATCHQEVFAMKEMGYEKWHKLQHTTYRTVLGLFKQSLTFVWFFHRKCSTLLILLMMLKVTSTWTPVTKSVFIWRPTSSESLHNLGIIYVNFRLYSIYIYLSWISVLAQSVLAIFNLWRKSKWDARVWCVLQR